MFPLKEFIFWQPFDHELKICTALQCFIFTVIKGFIIAIFLFPFLTTFIVILYMQSALNETLFFNAFMTFQHVSNV